MLTASKSKGIHKCDLWLGGQSVTDKSAVPLSRGEDEELNVETALQEFLQELKETQRDRVFLNFFVNVGFVYYYYTSIYALVEYLPLINISASGRSQGSGCHSRSTGDRAPKQPGEISHTAPATADVLETITTR